MSAGRTLLGILVAIPLAAYLVNLKEQPSTPPPSKHDDAFAQVAGFKDAKEYNAAKAYGITDPVKWSEHKAKMDEQAAAERARQTAERVKKAEEEYERTRDPVTKMKLKNFSWKKGGFGSVALVTLTIANENDFPVKDISVACELSANSGTQLSRISGTVYETIKARSTRTFPEFNMGFIHSQSGRSSCWLETAKRQ